MLDQAIGAKLDCLKTKWLAQEKAQQVSFEPRCFYGEPTIIITDTSNPPMHSQSIYEAVGNRASNWNMPTNSSGTTSAALVTSSDPEIVYVYTRNGYSRPWLYEISQIQPPTFRVIGVPSATSVRVITEPPPREVEMPAARSRQREIEWLSSNTDKLQAHQGHWIALAGDKIVVWGSDEVEVERRAKTKGIKAPLLFRVPSEGDKPFIGRSLHGYNGIR